MSTPSIPAQASLLRSALVSDALDAIGCRDRSLGPKFSPLQPGKVLVGRAFPVSVVPVDGAPDVPYAGLLRALDAIGQGDIYVVSSGGAAGVALWGELLSTIAIARGAVGAVCGGYVRDSAQIRALGFPVFAHGTVPLDINGRLEVTGHESPIEIDGVRVAPGELIVADDDGVVVVPCEVEGDVVERATAKAGAEDGFRADVAAGMLPSRAYEIHRVL
jgi:4-hydroxy-4-methyl-2-oxoglutarate aldolase